MKKILCLLLSLSVLISSCARADAKKETSSIVTTVPSTSGTTKIETTTVETSLSDSESATEEKPAIETDTTIDIDFSLDDIDEEYIENLGFSSLNDPGLLRYMQDYIYADLIDKLDSNEYFIERVEAVYISKEYIDEMQYNSLENEYFGYRLSDLDTAFEGKKYIFTLDENEQTTVQLFQEVEEDNSFEKIVKNVAIGTGVILLCVTVSVLTGGAAPAVSMVFAASAKGATVMGLSAGLFSGVTAGVAKGIQTQNFEEAIKAAALQGSESFKWGAITGAVVGGGTEFVGLRGATIKGLTMNDAAIIQRESKYPLSVIAELHNMNEYKVFAEAQLKAYMVGNETVLLPSNIDWNTAYEGMTNLERIKKGLAPIDPVNGVRYDLHHIGQEADATLAMIPETLHQKYTKILHAFKDESVIDRNAFAKQKKEFYKMLYNQLTHLAEKVKG